MALKELAKGIFQFSGFPPNAINIYLINDVLIDAGTKFAKGRIFRQLEGRTVTGHALTHAHPDHQGSSLAICRAFNLPVMVGAGDAEAVRTGNLLPSMPPRFTSKISAALMGGPACPNVSILKEGDEVAGFQLIEVPGHSPGHLAYWRESDRTLILGDVLLNMNLNTGFPGLHEPPTLFTPDPAKNRESARKLAILEPKLVLFGHGPPLKDVGKFTRFIAGLAK